MKEIKAFIKPSRVTNVVEALEKAGFESLTLSKGEGTGTHERPDATLDLEFFFTNSKVIKLELVCQNEETEKAIQLICKNARSPEPGDGIIYVTEIVSASRIKTGESLKRFNL
ncbi:MAG: P-II family nitrogen regulator [Bacteroidetes bacterium]|nr:MAG: P-II family nitrogen regulator [Bacteroidota bacterium]